MIRTPLAFLSLFLTSLADLAPAQQQITEPLDTIAERVKAGGELIEMQWRREPTGRLTCCPKGLDDWQPLIQDELAASFQYIGDAGWLMLWLQGDDDFLGMTDGERHMQRCGIGTADVELRQFVVTPLPAEGDLRHAATLDRMVAIDLLRRRGAKNAVGELGALVEREDLPEPLRRRAQDAIAALQGGTRTLHRLDPATLPLPVAADVYLVVDNGRIPDTSRLSDLGRRLNLLSNLAMIHRLKDPHVADFRDGQTASDVIGEIMFEFVRRSGNVRIDQLCAALNVHADESSPVDIGLQVAGEFDVATLQRALPGELADTGVELVAKDDTLTLTSGDFEGLIESTRVTAATKAMRGKPRPELAKKLLAGDAGIRVFLPANSKAWLALRALELPPAVDGELAISFLPTFAARATITAHDEDAAGAWVKRLQALLAEYVPIAETMLTAKGTASPQLAEVIAALKAIAVKADGKVVTIELAGKTFGWPTIEALVMSPARDVRVWWLGEHSVSFDTSEAGHGFADLEPLKAIIGNARIVALGEGTHGTREFFQMKHRLLEFLATEMGFTIFSIEANMPEAYELDDYVLGGPGDPKALIGGMYFWTWNTQEVLAMVEWMRAFNAAGKGPLHFTGFDMQTPDVAMRAVTGFLADVHPERAKEIEAQYAKLKGARDPDATDGGAAARGAREILDELVSGRDRLLAERGAKEVDWAIQNARIVEQSMRSSGRGVRDQSMAENVAWILERNPGARIVLWAHNAHIQRSPGWMGGYLAEKFGADYLPVGFATSEGRYAAMGQGGLGDHPLAPPPQESIEGIFAACGAPRLVLDLRPAVEGSADSGWLREFRYHRSIGALAQEEQFFPILLADCYDVLVYVRATSPAIQLDTRPGRR